MENKYKVAICAVALLVSFAAGRYSNVGGEIFKKLSQTKTVAKEDNKQDKTIHYITITTTSKNPDGTVSSITKTDLVSETKIDDKKSEKVDTKEVTKDVKSSEAKVSVSLLTSYNLKSPTVPAVGLSISKEILGPVIAGIWGFNNGTIGLSLGLEF